MTVAINSSPQGPLALTKSITEPPAQYSMINHNQPEQQYEPQYLTMNSERHSRRIQTSCLRRELSSPFAGTILTAYYLPLCLSTALQTLPQAPWPKISINQNYSSGLAHAVTKSLSILNLINQLMKIRANIFVVLRPNKEPTLINSDTYARKLQKLDGNKLYHFINTEDALKFIHNYNDSLNMKRTSEFLQAETVKQYIREQFSQNNKYSPRPKVGVGVSNARKQQLFVALQGDTIPRIYRSKQSLRKLGVPDERIFQYSTLDEAEQAIVDYVQKLNPQIQEELDNHIKGQKVSANKDQQITPESEKPITEEVALNEIPRQNAGEQDNPDQRKEKLQFLSEKYSLQLWGLRGFQPPQVTLDSTNSNNTYTLYFDGSTSMRGSLITSACGVVIYENKKRILKNGFYLGNCKSNCAEISGLLIGMKLSLDMGITRLNVFGDSELIIKFMLGVYKCKNQVLMKYYEACKDYEKMFEQITFKNIPRELNGEADEVADSKRQMFQDKQWK